MERLGHPLWTPRRTLWRAFALAIAAVAWCAVAATGAVLAVAFAAIVMMIALVGSALLALTAFAARARRPVRATADPSLLEARHLGGHSWVAYGWDDRR
jgi:dolichol kinase